MKSFIVLVVVLFAATLSAQVSETIDVRIINVDVTVTSKGSPVRGLTRDDFEIFEDGKFQPITNFYASEEREPLPQQRSRARLPPRRQRPGSRTHASGARFSFSSTAATPYVPTATKLSSSSKR